MPHFGGFDMLCRGPFDGGWVEHADRPAVAGLLAGVDVLNHFGESELADVWKDGHLCRCWLPQAVVGWEFFCLLWPQADGTESLTLDDEIQLLGGRPPGGAVSPSLLFAYVPAHRRHIEPSWAPGSVQKPGSVPDAAHAQRGFEKGQQSRGVLHEPRGGAPGGLARSVLQCEVACENVDPQGRTLAARLLAVCPCTIYRDSAQQPIEDHWGLFIGPRSRTLVLLNRHRGRVDLHLASLLAFEANFRLCEGLVSAVGRLFAPFGASPAAVSALFGPQLDPMRVHSGLTNAAVADHVTVERDGRDDYQRVFGVRLPSFFVSNASDNLCFLSPSEAKQLRAPLAAPLLDPAPLPALPRWTLLGGHVSAEDEARLREYRMRPPTAAPSGLFRQLLGLQVRSDWLPTFLAEGTPCSVRRDTERSALQLSPPGQRPGQWRDASTVLVADAQSRSALVADPQSASGATWAPHPGHGGHHLQTAMPTRPASPPRHGHSVSGEGAAQARDPPMAPQHLGEAYHVAHAHHHAAGWGGVSLDARGLPPGEH